QAFLTKFDQLPVRGYSVTIPHKETAATLSTQQDEAVTRIQAANTLLRGNDGWTSHNTDAPAALESIRANLPPTADGSAPTLRSHSVLLLGAGGVARALAHALRSEAGMLTISNRTPEKAHLLAEEVNCRAVDWAARH